MIKIKESMTGKKLHYERSIMDDFNDILPSIFFGLVGFFLFVQLGLNIKEELKVIGPIILFVVLSTFLLASTIKEYMKLDYLVELRTGKMESENKEMVIRIANKLKWRLLEDNIDHCILRNPGKLFNGGENITIICKDHFILFNSTSYPINDTTRTTLTFGANERNLNKFKKYLNELLECSTSHNPVIHCPDNQIT